jgi:prepilin-type N-terminal cleavage/methylation domain-containing protein
MTGFPQNRGVHIPHNGFTIFELLMVLAIMALIVGLFVANIDNAIRAVVRESPTDTLLKVVRQARLVAVTEKKPVSLDYNEETGEFLLRDHTQTVFYRLPIDKEDLKFIENLRFWPIAPMRLQGNRRTYEQFSKVDNPVERMQFAPTGVSSFVAVEFVYDPQVAEPGWILLDPFSNGELEGELE